MRLGAPWSGPPSSPIFGSARIERAPRLGSGEKSLDDVVAARIEAELKGQVLGGWTIVDELGAGKSAVVFRATRGSETGAVKVFDRELVTKYGSEAQAERGNREKQLIGKHHPNLIKTLDAGYDDVRDLFYVVMELFPGKNLADVLKDVPPGREHAYTSTSQYPATNINGRFRRCLIKPSTGRGTRRMRMGGRSQDAWWRTSVWVMGIKPAPTTMIQGSSGTLAMAFQSLLSTARGMRSLVAPPGDRREK